MKSLIKILISSIASIVLAALPAHVSAARLGDMVNFGASGTEAIAIAINGTSSSGPNFTQVSYTLSQVDSSTSNFDISQVAWDLSGSDASFDQVNEFQNRFSDVTFFYDNAELTAGVIITAQAFRGSSFTGAEKAHFLVQKNGANITINPATEADLLANDLVTTKEAFSNSFNAVNIIPPKDKLDANIVIRPHTDGGMPGLALIPDSAELEIVDGNLNIVYKQTINNPQTPTLGPLNVINDFVIDVKDIQVTSGQAHTIRLNINSQTRPHHATVPNYVTTYTFTQKGNSGTAPASNSGNSGNSNTGSSTSSNSNSNFVTFNGFEFGLAVDYVNESVSRVNIGFTVDHCSDCSDITKVEYDFQSNNINFDNTASYDAIVENDDVFVNPQRASFSVGTGALPETMDIRVYRTVNNVQELYFTYHKQLNRDGTNTNVVDPVSATPLNGNDVAVLPANGGSGNNSSSSSGSGSSSGDSSSSSSDSGSSSSGDSSSGDSSSSSSDSGSSSSGDSSSGDSSSSSSDSGNSSSSDSSSSGSSSSSSDSGSSSSSDSSSSDSSSSSSDSGSSSSSDSSSSDSSSSSSDSGSSSSGDSSSSGSSGSNTGSNSSDSSNDSNSSDNSSDSSDDNTDTEEERDSVRDNDDSNNEGNNDRDENNSDTVTVEELEADLDIFAGTAKLTIKTPSSVSTLSKNTPKFKLVLNKKLVKRITNAPRSRRRGGSRGANGTTRIPSAGNPRSRTTGSRPSAGGQFKLRKTKKSFVITGDYTDKGTEIELKLSKQGIRRLRRSDLMTIGKLINNIEGKDIGRVVLEK